ncbi:hypothetical protein [Streptomyces sp. NPDC001914]|uniref:hypothetical protein n=1 Tax=Streptomyces sp. NPDC001914 TaxID=3364623 RepID=UPI0036C66CE3
MDQGEAAVWAAGLGIAGTLAGALGGAFVQARAGRKQVHDQETVDVRHRLREERRLAFAAVLDRCDEVTSALGPIILARVQPEWRDEGDHRGLWAPANEALSALQRAVTSVKITGPDEMMEHAAAVHDTLLAKANAMRAPGLNFAERTSAYAAASGELDVATQRFVDAARRVLAAPHW